MQSGASLKGDDQNGGGFSGVFAPGETFVDVFALLFEVALLGFTFLTTGGAIRGDGVPFGEVEQEREHPLRDLLDAPGVDAVGIVRGSMVIVVKTCEGVNEGNTLQVEGVMIAIVGDFPGEISFEAGDWIVAGDDLAESGGGSDTADFDAFVLEASHHVDIQCEFDLTEWDCGRADPVFGAKEIFFLTIPKGKYDGASGSDSEFGESGSDFEEGGDAAGVVVSSVVNVSDGTEAGAGIAVADVIVMGADDDVFVAEGIIASREEAYDVLHVGSEFLDVGFLSADSLEFEFGEFLGEVDGGGTSAAGAGFAAFKGIAGEGVDVFFGVLGLDGFEGGLAMAEKGGGEVFTTDRRGEAPRDGEDDESDKERDFRAEGPRHDGTSTGRT